MEAVMRAKLVCESPEDDIELVNQGDVILLSQYGRSIILRLEDVETFARELVRFTKFTSQPETE